MNESFKKYEERRAKDIAIVEKFTGMTKTEFLRECAQNALDGKFVDYKCVIKRSDHWRLEAKGRVGEERDIGFDMLFIVTDRENIPKKVYKAAKRLAQGCWL